MKKYVHFCMTCALIFCFWWGILFSQAWQQEAVTASATGETLQLRFFFLEKLEDARNWLENRN